MVTYVVWQCENESCRFRFPGPVAWATVVHRESGDACPRCGATTNLAAPPSLSIERARSEGKQAPRLHLVALLDNIRSSFNVGAIFRTADGAGLRHLHLCGITATPSHPRVARTALGAEAAVDWTYHNNGVDAARMLAEQGHTLWALERGPAAEPLFAGELPSLPGSSLALVVGNEGAGIDPGIVALCHRVVSLPMVGFKGSLNVAVAFGIAVYHLAFGSDSEAPPLTGGS